MSQLLPFLILGALVIALLVHWSRRRRDRVVTMDEFLDVQKGLDSSLINFPAAKRIFDPSDMDFISRCTPETQRCFLQERKALAISWLRRTQQQMARLMDLHLRLAGYTYEPSTNFEFRLAMTYLSFRAICGLSFILVWLRGPFYAQSIVEYTIRTTDKFYAVFSRRLENINPARLASG